MNIRDISRHETQLHEADDRALILVVRSIFMIEV